VISWANSGVPFLRGAFGQFGRGNGLLYYFFATAIFVFSAKTFSSSSRKNVHKFITYFSWFLVVYAILQKIGIDIAKLNTLGLSPVVLTFGNSNFAGGMLSVLFTYHVVYHLVNKSARIRDSLLLILLIIAVTLPAAVQGYLIIGFSICLGASLYAIQHSKSVWLRYILGIAWLFGLLSIILGVMGKFLLAPVFARNSFQIRIEYWRIAISIIKDNLLFGVGPDRLFDVSSSYMEPDTLKIVTATRLDNAHNWYLNLGANFGLITFILLIAILGCVIVIGVKHQTKSIFLDPSGLAIFSAFFAVLIDGLVSLEQPGLGVWLYFFAGATIGNWLNSKNKTNDEKQKLKVEKMHFRQLLNKGFIVLNVIALIFSSYILSSRVINDVMLRASLQTQLLGKGGYSTLENIGSAAKSLRAEPEYTVKALQVLAPVGASSLIDSVSEATYNYYPKSLQATLIRADVLRAIGRTEESCPLRGTIVKNTPWSMPEFNAYVLCLTWGFKHQGHIEILTTSSQYLPVDEFGDIPVSDKELTSLKNRFQNFALAARVNLFLGNLEKANAEKNYAFKLLARIQYLEKEGGLAVQQPERNDNLVLLNF
jgi:O-antigen ligase